MDLSTINKRLLEILEELKKSLAKSKEIERVYELRKAELMMNEETKGFANQALRDAYVVKVMNEESLLKQYEESHTELRLLYIEKEILMEIARNIRELATYNMEK